MAVSQCNRSGNNSHSKIIFFLAFAVRMSAQQVLPRSKRSSELDGKIVEFCRFCPSRRNRCSNLRDIGIQKLGAKIVALNVSPVSVLVDQDEL